eukprot:COSAG01_NODE_14020_length_1506_cov_3.098081_2_plen_327_part_00
MASDSPGRPGEASQYRPSPTSDQIDLLCTYEYLAVRPAEFRQGFDCPIQWRCLSRTRTTDCTAQDQAESLSLIRRPCTASSSSCSRGQRMPEPEQAAVGPPRCGRASLTSTHPIYPPPDPRPPPNPSALQARPGHDAANAAATAAVREAPAPGEGGAGGSPSSVAICRPDDRGAPEEESCPDRPQRAAPGTPAPGARRREPARQRRGHRRGTRDQVLRDLPADQAAQAERAALPLQVRYSSTGPTTWSQSIYYMPLAGRRCCVDVLAPCSTRCSSWGGSKKLLADMRSKYGGKSLREVRAAAGEPYGEAVRACSSSNRFFLQMCPA